MVFIRKSQTQPINAFQGLRDASLRLCVFGVGVHLFCHDL